MLENYLCYLDFRITRILSYIALAYICLTQHFIFYFTYGGNNVILLVVLLLLKKGSYSS